MWLRRSELEVQEKDEKSLRDHNKMPGSIIYFSSKDFKADDDQSW